MLPAVALWMLPLYAQHAASNPTFTRDIAPILFDRCSTCHRPGQIGPMSFTSYREVRPWARAILASVQSRKMPPWSPDPHTGNFTGNPSLSSTQLNTLSIWVKQGAPEGDPNDLPSLPAIPVSWQLGLPDLILSTPEHTIEVGSEGSSQTFILDTRLAQDRWLQSVEVLPGNHRIVHHVEVALLTAESPHPVWLSYVPGQAPRLWPASTAQLLPAGARFSVTIHYARTSARDEKDRTRLGLRFAQRPPAQPIRRILLHAPGFEIPANADAHIVTATRVLDADLQILGYVALMRYRGKSLRLDAILPDGHTQPLLSISNYDPDWQSGYSNTVPVRLPAGTRLHLTATFDNSPNNRLNPDPSRIVRRGELPTDERLDVWLEAITPQH